MLRGGAAHQSGGPKVAEPSLRRPGLLKGSCQPLCEAVMLPIRAGTRSVAVNCGHDVGFSPAALVVQRLLRLRQNIRFSQRKHVCWGQSPKLSLFLLIFFFKYFSYPFHTLFIFCQEFLRRNYNPPHRREPTAKGFRAALVSVFDAKPLDKVMIVM